MKKMTAEDPESRTPDLVAENIRRLGEMFPELITEGGSGTSVNVDVLKQLVGEATITDVDEKYGLNWHGKRRARQLALTPSTGTLRPCPEDSVDWEATQNIMIEGDNLEVLKLLQKSYAGRVKLIYIDPPYNTGKDFVYPDNFQDSIANYLELTGQVEGGDKLSSNTESSGRFHTDWINMMYPRLRLSRALLREDGVLFVSIDDTEVANLRLVCDEIFGEENLAAHVLWQKKYSVSNDDPGIGVMHDHILVYRKSSKFARGLLPRTKKHNARYSNPDHDPKGDWASAEYASSKSKDERPTLWYPIIHPATGKEVWPKEHAVWRYSKDRHLELEAEGRLYWGPDQSYERPRLKRYLSEVLQGIVPSTWWTFEECGHNDEAKKETDALVGRKVFPTPKPTRLVQKMIAVAALEEGSIVMDFFAGSGSTGHAVMKDNSAMGTRFRFLLVQFPEPLSEKNASQRSAALFCDKIGHPRNLAELTKERLRRASALIKEENPMFSGDLGFRVFSLDSSNIVAWNAAGDDLHQTLVDHMEHIERDRSEHDILYELLLKLGLDLCVSIEQKKISGKTVYSVGGGVLLVCLSDQIPGDEAEALALGIVDWNQGLSPAGDTTCVFRDSAFSDDVAKTNVAAILQQHGITHVRSL